MVLELEIVGLVGLIILVSVFLLHIELAKKPELKQTTSRKKESEIAYGLVSEVSSCNHTCIDDFHNYVEDD